MGERFFNSETLDCDLQDTDLSELDAELDALDLEQLYNYLYVETTDSQEDNMGGLITQRQPAVSYKRARKSPQPPSLNVAVKRQITEQASDNGDVSISTQDCQALLTVVANTDVYEHGFVVDFYKQLHSARSTLVTSAETQMANAPETTVSAKLGWSIGPPHLTKHLQTVHQNFIYTCPTPLQEAVAQSLLKDVNRMDDPECYFNSLPQELESKRDRLAKLLQEAGLNPVLPEGGYFIIADVSVLNVDLSHMSTHEPYDYKFVKWMIKTKKLAAIPITAFCGPDTQEQFEKYIRFCFIKQDSTLDAAELILKNWNKETS